MDKLTLETYPEDDVMLALTDGEGKRVLFKSGAMTSAYQITLIRRTPFVTEEGTRHHLFKDSGNPKAFSVSLLNDSKFNTPFGSFDVEKINTNSTANRDYDKVTFIPVGFRKDNKEFCRRGHLVIHHSIDLLPHVE